MKSASSGPAAKATVLVRSPGATPSVEGELASATYEPLEPEIIDLSGNPLPSMLFPFPTA